MAELMIIFLAVAALCAVLCVMEGIALLAERIKPGCVDRLCEWIFR